MTQNKSLFDICTRVRPPHFPFLSQRPPSDVPISKLDLLISESDLPISESDAPFLSQTCPLFLV